MARSDEASDDQVPTGADRLGVRHFGDGLAGKLVAARLQGFYPTNADYRDVQVDAAGVVQTAGGGGGGGAVTIADGADVAQGTTSDIAWVSGSGSLIAISKAEFAKLEAIRALLAGTLTVGAHNVTNAGTFAVQATGTVTANAGTNLNTSALALDATLTGGTQKSKLVDTGGVNAAAVSAAGRLSVDASGVAVPITDNSGSLTVDAPVGTPAFVRLSDGAAAITTLPVSLATNTPDVTDRAARLLGHVTVDSAPTTAITAASLPLPTGASTSASQSAVKAASTLAAAADTSQVVQQSPMRADASTLCVTATGAAAAAVTVTLPSAGAGLFHYITSIQIVKFATALLTAAAAPVLVTTTNLPGSPVFSFSAAASAQGTDEVQTLTPCTPLKCSAAATPTTVVAPVTTATIWRITVTYYAAP